MEEQFWLASEWRQTESNQRAKFYRLTASGRRRLAAEQTRWIRLVSAISGVLNPLGGEA
jgi:PadR family transcriptional regulator